MRVWTLFILLFVGLGLNAQDMSSYQFSKVEEDWGAWIGVDGTYSFSKKLKTNLVLQTRFDENISDFKSMLAEQKTAYKFHKYLTVFAKFRITSNLQKSPTYRMTWGGQTRYKRKRWVASLRSQIQYQWRTQEAAENTWRNKVTIEYSKKKSDFTHYIYGEIFYYFDYQQRAISRYRLGLGTNYDINKRTALGLKYFYQRKFNIEIPNASHVVSIGYSLKFK